MATSVSTQQIGHFAEFGWIEFEKFLSLETCETFRLKILNCVATRLHTTPAKLSRFDEKKIYASARDIWRDEPFLKARFCSKHFATTASSLTHTQPLMLACDQWIMAGQSLEPLHLIDHLSFQDLACGCLIELETGAARFFAPERLPLFSTPQILIVYGNIHTVYVRNAMDPVNLFLKKVGYAWNDRLNSERNPICQTNIF